MRRQAQGSHPCGRQRWAIDTVRRLNGCEAEGKPWDKYCTLYPSKTGTPVVTLIHPGGHALPAGAPALIVKFFKEYRGM